MTPPDALVADPPDYLVVTTGLGMRMWLEAAATWGVGTGRPGQLALRRGHLLSGGHQRSEPSSLPLRLVLPDLQPHRLQLLCSEWTTRTGRPGKGQVSGNSRQYAAPKSRQVSQEPLDRLDDLTLVEERGGLDA